MEEKEGKGVETGDGGGSTGPGVRMPAPWSG